MKNLIIQKTKFLTAIISFTFILASCQNYLGKKEDYLSKKEPSKVIISTYDGGKITLQDANNELSKLIAKNEKLKGLTFDKISSDQKEAIIKEAVLNKLAYKEAKKRKLNKDQDYQEALELFETELLKQKLFIALAEESKNEENLKKNYAELVEKLKGKKDLRISYIALKNEKDANYIYRRLSKKPKSFSYYAKNKSIDKETAKKGGDLGFVFEDSLPENIAIESKALNKGQIAKPILTSGKWIIVKLEDERPAKIRSFEKSKDALANNIGQKAIEDFVSQSLEKAKISILLK